MSIHVYIAWAHRRAATRVFMRRHAVPLSEGMRTYRGTYL